MKKSIFIFLLIIICSINSFAQLDSNSAPVKWEKYKISKENISFMFPKFPVKLNFNDSCKQITGNTYYAFADDVVYQLKIFGKSKEKIPPFCSQKAIFNERSFTDYISMIQTEQDFSVKENIERGGNVFIKFEKESDSFKNSKWLLNDYKNLRWFEFTVSTYKEKNIEENQFVDSLKQTVDSTGTEINEGSDVLLGDELPKQNKLEENNILNDKNDNSQSSALNIIVKPKPKYTDKARKSNTVGNVRMRVTFLQNGAIGAVTPLNNLENGLTEQAIEAARKMAFLPQRRHNVKINVTKVVVYTFSIY